MDDSKCGFWVAELLNEESLAMKAPKGWNAFNKEKFWMWLIDLVHGARFKDSHEKALSNNVALREFRMNQVGHLKNVQNGKASWNIYLDR